jgi:hypothetical protein
VGRALRAARLIAGLVALRLAALGLERSDDKRNIRALAEHLSCSQDDARRLYRLARQTGYGAAYEEVFGSGETGPDSKGAGTDHHAGHGVAADAPSQAVALPPLTVDTGVGAVARRSRTASKSSNRTASGKWELPYDDSSR